MTRSWHGNIKSDKCSIASVITIFVFFWFSVNVKRSGKRNAGDCRRLRSARQARGFDERISPPPMQLQYGGTSVGVGHTHSKIIICYIILIPPESDSRIIYFILRVTSVYTVIFVHASARAWVELLSLCKCLVTEITSRANIII